MSASSDGHDRPTDPWSAYWARGALHSCAGSFEGNYGGAIGAFWDDVIARLPPGARVLDLATGNGALPLRLWEHHAARDTLRIDAVDLAEVAPRWFDPATHAGITFHPGVSIDRLPFPDGSFELVASQYGIEYAPLPAALEEALRVLRPGGTLALAMHHAGSLLVRVGRAEITHLRALLATDGVLASARAVLPWLVRARRGDVPGADAGAAGARAGYNAAMARIGEAVAAAEAPDVLVEVREQVHRLLAAAGAAGAAGGDPAVALDALEGALRDALARTSQMVTRALDADAVERLVGAIRAARPVADVRCEPLRQAEGVMAWGLVARG